MVEAVNEAGLPNGVFNVVTGLGTVVGAEMVRNPDVAKIWLDRWCRKNSTSASNPTSAKALTKVRRCWSVENAIRRVFNVFQDFFRATRVTVLPRGAESNKETYL